VDVLLENEKEARLFKITRIEGTEIKKIFKIILEEYDNIIL